MGLFDKKKKSDDFDSPVEQISLVAEPPPPRATPAAPQAAPARAGASTPAAAPAPAPAPPPEEPPLAFGINKAIELMRQLPKDNIELVVAVVKTTLESLHIKVGAIIEDATRKQGDIDGRIGVLKKEIAELEAEIAARRDEIARLEADHKETTEVKERLILAEKITRERAAGAAGAAAAGGGTVESGWET